MSIFLNEAFSQVIVKNQGEIRYRLIYGQPQNKIQNDINITEILHSGGGSSLYHPYKYIIIENNWTTLFGDLVYNNGVTWKLNEYFTFIKDGQYYNIDQNKLSKYPDLIKRLKNAKPANWNMAFNFNESHANEGYKPGWYKITFMISDNDIITGIDGENSYMVPGSPNKFSDRIKSDYELKTIWGKITNLNFLSIEKLSIQNPIEEWYNIVQLYNKYEKEGYKTISDEIEEERKDDLRRYSKDDDWSIPFEDNSGELIIEYSKNDETFVIKKGQKIVKKLPQGKYSSISKLDDSDKWIAQLENGDSYGNRRQILTSKGDPLTIDGTTNFWQIDSKGSQLELIQKTSGKLFNERSDTRGLDGGYYESSSAAISSFNKAKQEYKDYWARKSSGSSSGGVIIAMGPRPTIIFNVKIISTDKKFNIKNTKSGAYLTSYDY